MLDLIEIGLAINGYRFARLDGDMSIQRRKSAIDDFRKNAECTVLLASLGSAGVG
jgi:SWI/SNF-related matrix-associated actin-dependent regulator of chromatin subfamily A3